MVKRFRFHWRQQELGESVAAFEAELQKMASQCEFGEGSNDTLRDRLVCGLREEAYRKRLLAEPDLTHSKALTIAQGLEAAEQHARSLRGSSTAVHQVSQSKGASQGTVPLHHHARTQGRGKECYRCGSADHLAATCCFVDTICHQCKKKGHLARVCRSGKAGGGHKAIGVKALELTGCPTSIALHTYTAERVEVMGSLPVHVEYGDQEKDLSLVIANGNGLALLGRDWLAHIRQDWAVLAYQTSSFQLEALLQKYEELFHEELGKVTSVEVSLSLKENSQPKFFPLQTVPFAIKDAITKEIECLESTGVLEKVEFSK